MLWNTVKEYLIAFLLGVVAVLGYFFLGQRGREKVKQKESEHIYKGKVAEIARRKLKDEKKNVAELRAERDQILEEARKEVDNIEVTMSEDDARDYLDRILGRDAGGD